MIEGFSFGVMQINGKQYFSDVILYPDRIEAQWWRRDKHRVCIADVVEMLRVDPQYLLIGTGQPGNLRVAAETQEYILSQGIQLIYEPTEFAYQMYNEIYMKRWVVGAFHLKS
jgi:hypothetical protein